MLHYISLGYFSISNIMQFVYPNLQKNGIENRNF